MNEPIALTERLARALFPAFRPFWRHFWTGMLLGFAFSGVALALLVAMS